MNADKKEESEGMQVTAPTSLPSDFFRFGLSYLSSSVFICGSILFLRPA
jgi:hypothetical protein